MLSNKNIVIDSLLRRPLLEGETIPEYSYNIDNFINTDLFYVFIYIEVKR